MFQSLQTEGESMNRYSARLPGMVVGIAIVALTLTATQSVSAATPRPVSSDSKPAATPPPTRLHVFLAIGQSNMSGRGLPAGGSLDPANPRILQYGAKHRALGPATVPLDMHDTATGISPATTFAREYLKSQPSRVGVLIIPAAHGSTGFTGTAPILTWSVGAAVAPNLDLPMLAVTQVREGMAAAAAAGYDVVLKGILWHQGESNSAMSTAAYSARLDTLIAFFRSSFNAPTLPFVVGQMTPEGIAATPGRSNVDAAHRGTPTRMAYTGFAPAMTGGVNPGQTTHFSRIGVQYLGNTYLAAYNRARLNTRPGLASDDVAAALKREPNTSPAEEVILPDE
jgi:hypothetical protein